MKMVKPLVVVRVGTVAERDMDAMRSEGYVVVESRCPEAVRVVGPEAVNDVERVVMMAALEALGAPCPKESFTLFMVQRMRWATAREGSEKGTADGR